MVRPQRPPVGSGEDGGGRQAGSVGQPQRQGIHDLAGKVNGAPAGGLRLGFDGTAAGLDPLACNLDRAGGEVDVTSLQGDAIKIAAASRGGRDTIAGVIFHSDRGSTYTASSFTVLCKDKLGIRQSMGRVGSCFDKSSIPPGDACVTARRCPACGLNLPAGRSRRFCSPACRQAAGRCHQQSLPPEVSAAAAPVPAAGHRL